eukprot:1349269-Alexandrium_andersonii.AAC.1
MSHVAMPMTREQARPARGASAPSPSSVSFWSLSHMGVCGPPSSRSIAAARSCASCGLPCTQRALRPCRAETALENPCRTQVWMKRRSGSMQDCHRSDVKRVHRWSVVMRVRHGLTDTTRRREDWSVVMLVGQGLRA